MPLGLVSIPHPITCPRSFSKKQIGSKAVFYGELVKSVLRSSHMKVSLRAVVTTFILPDTKVHGVCGTYRRSPIQSTASPPRAPPAPSACHPSPHTCERYTSGSLRSGDSRSSLMSVAVAVMVVWVCLGGAEAKRWTWHPLVTGKYPYLKDCGPVAVPEAWDLAERVRVLSPVTHRERSLCLMKVPRH